MLAITDTLRTGFGFGHVSGNVSGHVFGPDVHMCWQWLYAGVYHDIASILLLLRTGGYDGRYDEGLLGDPWGDAWRYGGIGWCIGWCIGAHRRRSAFRSAHIEGNLFQ